jgi:IS30 family transposase
LPRKHDIAAVRRYELKMTCDHINAKPGKCLGWKTPAKVFRETMME